jgi:branched-chain amino acid transport system permease protein
MGDGIWFFLQLLVQGLAVGSVYSLVALGFVLIYKASGVINFAQGEFLMLGAYACLAFMVQTNLPFWAALGLTVVVMALVALILERLVLRPLIGEPVISIIMATIGLAAVFKAATAAAWGTQLRSFPAIFPDQPVRVGEIVISQVYIWTFCTAMLLMVAFALFFKVSRLGVAMRATANSHQVALSMGISVKAIFALSWCISAVVSAIGGVLIGSINGVNITFSASGSRSFRRSSSAASTASRRGHRRAVVSILGASRGLPLAGLRWQRQEVAPFVFLVIILMVNGGLLDEEIEECRGGHVQ